MGINKNSIEIIDLTAKTFRKLVKTPGTVSDIESYIKSFNDLNKHIV